MVSHQSSSLVQRLSSVSRGSSTHLVYRSNPFASVFVDGPGPSHASSTAKLRLQDLRAGAKCYAKQTHLSSEKAALTPINRNGAAAQWSAPGRPGKTST